MAGLGEAAHRGRDRGVPAGQILFSFIAFSLLFAALAAADWVLMARVAKRGPEPVATPKSPPSCPS